ncbi:MAG: hypothetical protein K8F31_08140 [Roseovarius sp.]|nr:hypothetical protein [Roseovarius sp.]
MTNKSKIVAPVSNWENAHANGLALLNEEYFQERLEYIKALRRRQATYLDSLPDEPREAIRAAWAEMHPEGERFPDGIEQALYLAYALSAQVKAGDADDEGLSRDAVLWVADRIALGLHRATFHLDRISDLLAKAVRPDSDDDAAEGNGEAHTRKEVD